MPPPRNALINGVFDFWSKGATHVDICTNIQETLRILKEGATHVDICTNIQKTLRLSKKGNTQVDIISNALRTMGDGARSAGKETKRNQIIHSKKTKAAFTLAEVLITLGIIGVVAAALTLPNLIANYQNKVFAAHAKKAYSSITQAIKMAEAEYGTPGDVTGLFDTSQTSRQLVEKLSKYFDTIDLCLNQSECPKYKYDILYSKPLYEKDKTATTYAIGAPLFILKDGTTISARQEKSCKRTVTFPSYSPDGVPVLDKDGNQVTYDTTKTYCGMIYFDTNGTKGPNQAGVDFFEVRFSADGRTQGWVYTGYESLLQILQGKDPIYTKYKKGDKKE